MAKQVELFTDDNTGRTLLTVRTRLVSDDMYLDKVLVNGRFFVPAQPTTDEVMENPTIPYYEIVNACIKDTSIRFNDNDELCVKLVIQGNGIGTTLTFPISRLNALLSSLGLFEYDYLRNSFIRLRIEYNTVRGIGHIINEEWFTDLY